MVIKPERVDVQEKKEVQKTTPEDNVPSYEAPRYHIYGGWMNDESYILIKSDDAGGEDRSKFTLEKIPKKGKGKILKPVIRINWIKTNRYNI